MKAVQILELNDDVHPEDWCRPLELSEQGISGSDYFATRSTFSGTPVNNFKWAKAKDIFGPVWFSPASMVREFCRAGLAYEFVRGYVPDQHKLDMSEYNSAI